MDKFSISEVRTSHRDRGDFRTEKRCNNCARIAVLRCGRIGPRKERTLKE